MNRLRMGCPRGRWETLKHIVKEDTSQVMDHKRKNHVQHHLKSEGYLVCVRHISLFPSGICTSHHRTPGATPWTRSVHNGGQHNSFTPTQQILSHVISYLCHHQ